MVFPSSSYALGIFFLVIVSLLWTICSMVVQHLYNDMQFDSPFLIVYIGTSLFSIFLPIRLGYERWGHCFMESCNVYGECLCCCCDHGSGEGGGGKEYDVVIIPWKNIIISATEEHEVVIGGDGGGLMRSESNPLRDNGNENGVEMHSLPANYQDQSASSFGDEYSVHNYEPSLPPLSRDNNNASPNNTNSGNKKNYLLSHQDHISMASKVAPLWFLSNYFYAMSLEWTSISSSTVLASMGSIFAFGFATCSRFGDEKVTKGKLLGVTLCFLGGVATTWTDVGSGSNNGGTDDGGADGSRHLRYLRHSASFLANDSPIRTLLGDLAGFLSAVGYGAYTVLLRYLCPKDEDRMSMQLLFGYIGLWNMILLLPVAIWVIVSSNDGNSREEVHSEPSSEWEEPPSSDFSGEDDDNNIHTIMTWSIFLFLILKGLLDNVLSDYLWARAVMLTSATVASVGVGLTIPMAFVADWIMGNYNGTQAGEVWGATLVLLGFIFVNINVFGEKGDGEEEPEEVAFEEEDGRMDAHSAHDVDAEIFS
ncbi:hypothetical protein ACHAXR_003570 [Thalassiosira sp. AJA248-18]